MRILVGKNIGRLIGLILVTVFAVAVMLANLGRNRSTPNPSNDPKGPVLTKAPVSVLRVEPRKTEILLTSSGMIRPFERYTLAFETAGRVAALGKNERGDPLDDGDRVRADQILAVLDQRILVARKQETAAQLEQAQSDLQRARDLRSRSPGTVTDAEYQEHVTAVAVAKAQAEIAQKNLEDATLRSPVDGVISKRYVNAGESVTPQQIAFEIVQVDDVLLVVGVPESRVGELESRRRAIAANRTEAEQARRLGQPVPFDEDDLRFKAHVQLIGRDRYGRPWPKIDGEVYRIGETADDKTGLFEVEILLPNREGTLRPGQIAVAEMVIDRITACRVPLSAALFQGEKTYLFTVEQDEPRGNAPDGKVGRAKTYRARRYELDRYIEQGEDLIIPDLPEQYRTAVVRGQYRIFDGRPVEIVPLDGGGSGAQPREDSVPAPVIGARP